MSNSFECISVQTDKVKTPTVSVVMSVYNDAENVRETIESVVSDPEASGELIIINDGSNDGSAAMLDHFANEFAAIKVVHQQNAGLTAALRYGCSLVTTRYVARQDSGDKSLPGRLELQADYLDQHPEVVAVGCGVRWIGPKGEYLGEWVRNQSPEETTSDLIEHGIGFVHPSVMFRRDAYEKAGGYRPQFRFAQDHDLWYRMAEQGLLATCPEVLFEYRMDISGISPQNRVRQKRLGELARECYFARKSGKSEACFLEEANRVSWDSFSSIAVDPKHGQGATAYFIGSQLYERRDQRCRRYLQMALAAQASPIKAALKYATSFLNCYDKENSR